MHDAWNLLMEMGLPDGAVRPPPRARFDPIRVRAAVLDVAAPRALKSARVAPLLAWLAAWEHHWGDHFARTLGPRGTVLLRRLRRRLDDPNRYLKLRRIAITNLATLL